MGQRSTEQASGGSATSRLMVTLLIVAALGFLIEMLVMKGLGYFGNSENQHIADFVDAVIVALLVGPIAAAVVLVRHPRKDIDTTHLLSGRAGKGLAVLVFVMGMAAASGAAMIAARQVAAADETRFHRLSERVAGEVSRRFQLFEYGLQGSRGLWRASKSVERGEFADWVRSRDLKREFLVRWVWGSSARFRWETLKSFSHERVAMVNRAFPFAPPRLQHRLIAT